MERPSLLVARIDGPNLPFGGTWTYQIAPARGRIGPHDHRERRSVQRDLPVHVALRVRPSRDDGRLHQAPAGRAAASNEPKDDQREEFVSTRQPDREAGREGGHARCSCWGSKADCAFMDELRERGARVRTGGNKRDGHDLRRCSVTETTCGGCRSLVPRLKRGRRPVDPASEGIARPEGIRDDEGRTGRRAWSTSRSSASRTCSRPRSSSSRSRSGRHIRSAGRRSSQARIRLSRANSGTQRVTDRVMV